MLPPTTEPGVVLLNQVATRPTVIDVACNRCDRCGRLHSARLMLKHRCDMPVPRLLRIIATYCPRMQASRVHTVCGIHLPQLSRRAL